MKKKFLRLLKSLKIIKQVHNYDLFKNEMIKSALPFLSKPITKAFNMILNTGKFTESWKTGIIIPVHKKMEVSLTQTIAEVLLFVVAWVSYSVI